MNGFDVEVHVLTEAGEVIVRLDEIPCVTKREARRRGRQLRSWLRRLGARRSWMQVFVVRPDKRR